MILFRKRGQRHFALCRQIGRGLLLLKIDRNGPKEENVMSGTAKRELAKTYDPKGIEDRIYQKWLEKKYFHAEVDKSKKPFTIVIMLINAFLF